MAQRHDISLEDRQRMVELVEMGLSRRKVAERYKVSLGLVRRLISKKEKGLDLTPMNPLLLINEKKRRKKKVKEEFCKSNRENKWRKGKKIISDDQKEAIIRELINAHKTEPSKDETICNGQSSLDENEIGFEQARIQKTLKEDAGPSFTQKIEE
uniref:HTH psq-type domain-containing protein n=1 Tax=Panagrolaimus sp. JU765 TaxID=591449 RepID=A0AC34R642_9BILA